MRNLSIHPTENGSNRAAVEPLCLQMEMHAANVSRIRHLPELEHNRLPNEGS